MLANVATQLLDRPSIANAKKMTCKNRFDDTFFFVFYCWAKLNNLNRLPFRFAQMIISYTQVEIVAFAACWTMLLTLFDGHYRHASTKKYPVLLLVQLKWCAVTVNLTLFSSSLILRLRSFSITSNRSVNILINSYAGIEYVKFNRFTH